MTGAEIAAALAGAATVLPKLVDAGEELAALIKAKEAGVSSEAIVAALQALLADASATAMKQQFPNG